MKWCDFCGMRLENPHAKYRCQKCRFDVAKTIARRELDRGVAQPEPLREKKPEIVKP